MQSLAWHVGRFTARCLPLCPARSSSSLPVGTIGVSSHGRIQNRAGVITWGCKASSGYCVTKVGGQMNMVHRLVARAFLGPPPTHSHRHVHHRDADPSNNHVDNLEYVTHSQNVMYSYLNNAARRTSAEALSKPVLARPVGYGRWCRYPSISEASRRLHVQSGRIAACCKGRRRLVKGYEFQYADIFAFASLPGEEWRAALRPEDGVVLSQWKVSSLGRVMSSHHVTWGTVTSHGYRSVGVTHDKKVSSYYVHRLVARAFLGPVPDQHYQVHHRDYDRANNRIDNLEYATPSENVLHSFRFNSDRRSHAHARGKPVWGRMLGAGVWTWYPSMNEAARQVGVSSAAISACFRRGAQHTRGFEFRPCEPTSPRLLPGEEWRQVILDV